MTIRWRNSLSGEMVDETAGECKTEVAKERRRKRLKRGRDGGADNGRWRRRRDGTDDELYNQKAVQTREMTD
jgi:hypothetical protein